MHEHQILFSAPMVRAILAGTKTQTRRPVRSPARTMQREGMEVIKHREPGDPWYRDCVWSMRGRTGVWGDYKHSDFMALCPFGRPGDVLWVRETWAAHYIHDGTPPGKIQPTLLSDRWYRADGEIGGGLRGRWRPSIHMPRWAARIWLRVLDVRAEQVRSLTEEDARAEGVMPEWYGDDGETCGDAFEREWKAIYGCRSWDDNHWVWRVSFERCAAPAREETKQP